MIVFFKERLQWIEKVMYYVAIVTRMYIINQLHSFKLKEKHQGDAQHAWTPRHDWSCDHNSASPWFLNKVSLQTRSFQVRWHLLGNYTGEVTQTHPAGRRDDKNRRKWKSHKHLNNKVTEDKRGSGWEDEEVRGWTWGLSHLKPLIADQRSSKKRDAKVQQLRRGGELMGWESVWRRWESRNKGRKRGLECLKERRRVGTENMGWRRTEGWWG